MTWEAWAVIIAAVITALGTIAATTYNDLIGLLRKPSRNVKGEWEAKSYRIDSIPPADESRRRWIGDYVVSLKQRGGLVKGEMTAVRVHEDMKPYKYIWKGEVMGNYLMYQCVNVKHPDPFTISSAMLTISALGDHMSGYFVANAGLGEAWASFVGFTELRKRE